MRCRVTYRIPLKPPLLITRIDRRLVLPDGSQRTHQYYRWPGLVVHTALHPERIEGWLLAGTSKPNLPRGNLSPGQGFFMYASFICRWTGFQYRDDFPSLYFVNHLRSVQLLDDEQNRRYTVTPAASPLSSRRRLVLIKWPQRFTSPSGVTPMSCCSNRHKTLLTLWSPTKSQFTVPTRCF